ncbi:MAG: HAD family hydrolase [Phycisphaerales bacterium]
MTSGSNDDRAHETSLSAMWSGARNISTALMRSWEARVDTLVIDEPLYAHHLSETGLDHPAADEVIEAGETDLGVVVSQLTALPPEPFALVYQKHMAHHLLPGTDLSWVDGLSNALLVREPRELLTSLLQVLPNPDLDSTGLPAQVGLLERFGGALPVGDSKAVLMDPGAMLRALCESLGVPFTERMLAWEPGPRATDGVWARHWYGSVERSTGFGPYKRKDVEVPRRHLPLLRSCEALYDRLVAHALTPAGED